MGKTAWNESFEPADNLAEPNSSAWFAFGAIYEQFGVLNAAVAAFKKVEKPDGAMSSTDTYLLAQMHLKALHEYDDRCSLLQRFSI